MERAVKRGLRAKGKSVPARLGVDEKALSKGARYITLVCDLDAATIEHVAEARRMESLDGYFLRFSAAELEGIRAIAMDMWPPYIASTLRLVPGARDKIVFDLYHVMSFMNEAVDEVRKREHREHRARGDETLARSRYLWLYAQERLPPKHQERFASLRAMNLKTGRAWAIKESLREFWKMPTREEALVHWKHWYRWATHSRLKPVIKTAKNIQQKLHNVLTYFTHRITNAVAEGLNSKIQTIKKGAYGFRSFENFKTAIFFHCGGLRLYPVTLQPSGARHAAARGAAPRGRRLDRRDCDGTRRPVRKGRDAQARRARKPPCSGAAHARPLRSSHRRSRVPPRLARAARSRNRVRRPLSALDEQAAGRARGAGRGVGGRPARSEAI